MISKPDKVILKAFVDNKPLMEAVRRVMTAKIYEQGGIKSSTKNFVFALKLDEDDAVYGNKIKVLVKALYEIEEAFQGMVFEVNQTDKPAPEQINEAR